ncbi:MAG: bifunctional oligoribonuclease/PAP phosphatase NrnA [Clostridiales bacterium]|jgi:phosphoesterase RecJ-like protein|nr:bifunctional oligoribonuclease/PAP phosphatase NrnA [Clostridiales bacterium]
MTEVNKHTTIEKIVQTICESQTIAIAGHISPDGDAAASCFALALSIKKLNKNPVVLLESLPGRYRFIKGQEMLYTGKLDDLKPDLFIACDCGTVDRLGKYKDLFEKTKRTIVIDHHISNDGYGLINYVKPNASSTSELVYDISHLLGTIDKDIAIAIYAGIIFDTGGFRFSSTSPDTMIKISKLMEYDIPFSEVYTQTMLSHTFEEAKMLSFCINRMSFYEDKALIYTYVTLSEMEALNCTREDLEGVVEYMLNTKGALVSVLIYESEIGKCKVSFRSKSIDVNAVASNWGGGGHKAASGCAIYKAPEEAVSEILEFIGKRL